MANFPILKMMNIDGRQVPFVYPQHKKEAGGYVETGEDNPLPTYDKSALAALDELKILIKEQESKTKSVEVTNNPTDYPDSAVKQELELIKQENAEIKQAQSDIISALQTSNENLQSTNEALLSVIKDNRLQSDTQLTGSIVKQEQAIPVNQLTRNVKVIKLDASHQGVIEAGKDKFWDILAPAGWMVKEIVDVRMMVDKPEGMTTGYHMLSFGRIVLRSKNPAGNYALSSGRTTDAIRFSASDGGFSNETVGQVIPKFPSESSQTLLAYKLLSFDDETPIQAYYANNTDADQTYKIDIQLRCIVEKKVGE